MPFTWIDPKVAKEIDGKKIYRTYKNDRLDMIYQHWFTTDVHGVDGWDDFSFDLREIKIPKEYLTTESKLAYIINNDLVRWP